MQIKEPPENSYHEEPIDPRLAQGTAEHASLRHGHQPHRQRLFPGRANGQRCLWPVLQGLSLLQARVFRRQSTGFWDLET